MSSLANRETTRIYNSIVIRLRRLYSKADKNIRKIVKTASIYFDNEDATRRERTRYANNNGMGEIVDEVAEVLLLCNEKAIDTINESLDEIFALNFLAMVGRLGLDISAPSFNLSKALSKYTKRAYRRETNSAYLSQEVEKALKQSLEKGKGVRETARNIQKVTNKSRTSAMTTARTETFRIANDAKYQVFEEAAATGLTVNKIWRHEHPTNDPRRWHIRMDGETVPWNEPFSNGLMYPCEAGAPAEEVINCGCGMDGEVV